MSAGQAMEVLVRRIAKQETQLATLRRRLDGRLSRLNRRREKLRSELRTIETQIELVGGDAATGELIAIKATRPALVTTEPGLETPTRGRKRRRKSRMTPSLALVIENLVRELNGRPITLKAMTEELVRRKFPSSSKNFGKMVENRAYDLTKNRILRSLPDRAGFVLGTAASKVARPAPVAATKPTKGTRPGTTGPTIRDLVLSILGKESKPLTVRELSQKILAAGFQTKSSDFSNVLRVFLTKLTDRVERAPQGGYRLKQGK